jgi:hypothetical protein
MLDDLMSLCHLKRWRCMGLMTSRKTQPSWSPCLWVVKCWWQWLPHQDTAQKQCTPCPLVKGNVCSNLRRNSATSHCTMRTTALLSAAWTILLTTVIAATSTTTTQASNLLLFTVHYLLDLAHPHLADVRFNRPNFDARLFHKYQNCVIKLYIQ